MKFAVLAVMSIALGMCSSFREPGEGIVARPVVFSDNEKTEQAFRKFSYSIPQEASRIPKLERHLLDKRHEALADQKEEWNLALKEFSGPPCANCLMREFREDWKVAANTGRFLSLVGETHVFAGGAHGNSYFDTILWDKEMGREIELTDLFVSDAALAKSLRSEYCEALGELRLGRLGESYNAADAGPSDCPAIDELAILPASPGGETFDRIVLLAAPYVVGAYAEGSYEVTLPVTQNVMASLRPEYRKAFAIR